MKSVALNSSLSDGNRCTNVHEAGASGISHKNVDQEHSPPTVKDVSVCGRRACEKIHGMPYSSYTNQAPLRQKIPNGAPRYYSPFSCNFACFRVTVRKLKCMRRLTAVQRIPCSVAQTLLWQATRRVDVCNSLENLSCRPRYLWTLGILIQMQRSPNVEGSAEHVDNPTGQDLYFFPDLSAENDHELRLGRFV